MPRKSDVDYLVDRTQNLEDEAFADFAGKIAEKSVKIREQPKDGLTHIIELEDELKQVRRDRGKFRGFSTGYRSLDAKMGGLERGSVCLIAGETCLHPETEIYDPIDGSTDTVEQRYKRATPFHVFALTKNGKGVVIAPANPPKRFKKAKMIELVSGKQRIVVTPKHRIFDGSQYRHVSQLAKDGACRLPTISGHGLKALLEDGQRYRHIIQGSRCDCPACRRLYDELPQVAKGIVRASFPSRDDVRELSRYGWREDAPAGEVKHSRLYRWFDRLSSAGFSRLGNRIRAVVSHTLLGGGTSSPIFPKLRGLRKSGAYSGQNSRGSHISRPVPDSIGCVVYQAYAKDKQWTVKPQEDEMYYDFEVPHYHNYFAAGLFHHNSHGKSALVTNIAMHLSDMKGTDASVLYISLEMTLPQMLERLDLVSGQDMPPMNLIFQKSFAIGYRDLEPLVRRAKQEHAIDVVVIDYLQYLGRGMTLDEVAKMSKEVKSLALRYDVCMVVITSVRKGSAEAKFRRKWTDIESEEIMGSAAIGYDADQIIVVSRKDMEGEYDDSHIWVKVLKTRNAKLDFNDRFVELSWDATRITERM